MYKSNELKYLQKEIAALKSFVLEQVFIIKQYVKLNYEHSSNAESRDYRELINSLVEQKDHLKRQLDERNNIISLLIKTRISYLIKEPNVSNNTKDNVSNENVSSNSNVEIPNCISNNSNYNSNTNITVNKDDVVI